MRSPWRRGALLGAFWALCLAVVLASASGAEVEVLAAGPDGIVVVNGTAPVVKATPKVVTKRKKAWWWPFGKSKDERAMNKALVKLGSKKQKTRSDLAMRVLHMAGADLGALLKLIEVIADKIDDMPFLGDKLIRLLDEGIGDNVLEAFGSRADVLLNGILKTVWADTYALTSANISDPRGDYSDKFNEAYAWPHGLFPGVVTNGYDPTLIDTDVMFLLENGDMNALFTTPALKPAVDALWLLQDGALAMTPEAQGVWVPTQSNKHFNVKKTLFANDNLEDRYALTEEMVSPASLKIRELFDWMPPRGSADPVIPMEEVFDDLSFSRFFFAGIAQNNVRSVHGSGRSEAKAEGATFVAPFDYLAAMEVKPDTGKYGGDVYFDDKGMVTHIVYDGQRYDPTSTEWHTIKRNVRGTVVCVMTLIDHLLGVHLHYSNSLAWAVPQLTPTHPLRALLWSHIVNANGVNRKAAASLSLAGGLFARGWALTGKGVGDLYEHVKAHHPLFKWMTVPERMAQQGFGDFRLPYHEDGLSFYNVMHEYISNYLDVHYASDADVTSDAEVAKFLEVLNEHAVNKDTAITAATKQGLADVIASYLFHVTGFHTMVGSMHHEATRSGIAPSMWYEDAQHDQGGSPPNSYFWRKITFIMTSSLRLPITGDTCSTELRCGFKEKIGYQNPLPPNANQQRPIKAVGYPELFLDDASKRVNIEYIEQLLGHHKDVVKRNKARHRCKDALPLSTCRPFNAFDLNYVENGVAI